MGGWQFTHPPLTICSFGCYTNRGNRNNVLEDSKPSAATYKNKMSIWLSQGPMISPAVLIRTYTRLPPICTRQSSKQRRGQDALASFLCLSILLTSSSIHFEQVCQKDFQQSFCTQTETLHLPHRGPAVQLSAGTIHLAHLTCQRRSGHLEQYREEGIKLGGRAAGSSRQQPSIMQVWKLLFSSLNLTLIVNGISSWWRR